MGHYILEGATILLLFLIFKRLIMTQAELAQALRDAAAEADKAKAEVLQKISDLEAAISTAGSTTPEVDEALAALKTSVGGIDDIVPDVPTA